MNSTLTLPDPAKAREYFEHKMAFTTGPVELERAMKSGDDDVIVVDVRRPEDFRRGHVPGAINLPHEKWENATGLSREKTNVLYCYSQVCHLAATAAVELTGQGYPVKELEGGFEGWKEQGLKVETSPTSGSSTKENEKRGIGAPPHPNPQTVPAPGERANEKSNPPGKRRREEIAAGTGAKPSQPQPPISETGEPKADVTPGSPKQANL